MNLRPYPVYKDSGVPWLGTVPQHWKVTRLKNVCRFSYGEPLPADARRDGNVPVFGSNGRVGYHASANSLGPCIIIGRKGSFGKVTYSAEPGFAIDTTFLVDARHTTHNLRLLYYLLGWLRLDQVSRDSAVPGLDRTDAYQRPCSLTVDPNEQLAIVRYLDYMDRRIRRYIRAKRRLIALLNEQKQAIIQRAVTGGLDPNVRLKPSGVEWLGDVPAHWDTRPTKRYFREVNERSSAGSEELLSVSHITGVTPRAKKQVTMFMAESYAGHKLCRADDLVVNTMWAWMGALGVARQTGIVSPSYAVYRPLHPDVFLPRYVDLLLRTTPYVSEYACRSTGIRSSRLRLYPDQFLRIPIVCPPVPEQQVILDQVDTTTADLELMIETTQQEIHLIHEYRTRLIADVVTGKLDVREAAAHLPDEADEPEPPDEEEVLDSAGDDMDVVDIIEDAEEFVA